MSPSSSADSCLMQMRGVAKSFGATRALQDVDLEVRPGEVLALIGENGAGKSTLMKILSGAIPPDAGRMVLNGRPYSPAGPHAAQAAGVAMIYQELNLAPDLNVEDNIMLGQEIQRLGLLNRRTQHREVRRVLDLLGHPELRPETPVQSLSIGAQQLVEIARALVMQTRMIVFDEPTSSLARRDVEHLFDVIRKLKQSQIAIIYISHFLEEIREIGDRFTVLRDGEVAGGGQLQGTGEKEIISLMVGRSVDELFPVVEHRPGEVILSLSELSGTQKPTGVSFDLRRGEILGIAGLVGAGRTELLRAIFSLDPIRSGKVTIAGRPKRRSTRSSIRAGLGFVAEDRKGEGLAQSRSIADNITYSRLAPYRRWGWLSLGRRRRAVLDWMKRIQVKAASPEQHVAALSGGNQQKVALARVLHQEADVLLLDEPTRGIDVGTKTEIYRLMGELAAAGKAIIFVSSYLPELMAVCDRIGVMARGRLKAIRATEDWTEESVMATAVSSVE